MDSLHDPNAAYHPEHDGYANAPQYAHQRGESAGSMVDRAGSERYDDDPRYQPHPQQMMHDPHYPPPGGAQQYYDSAGPYTEYPSDAAMGRVQGPTPTMASCTDEQAYNGGLQRPEEGRMHPGKPHLSWRC